MTASPISESLNIISYNILASRRKTHKFESANSEQVTYLLIDNRKRLSDVAQRIIATNADIACLQEVDSRNIVVLEQLLTSNNYQCFYDKECKTHDKCLTAVKTANFKSVQPGANYDFGNHPGKSIQKTQVTTRQGKQIEVWNTQLQNGAKYQEIKNKQAIIIADNILQRSLPVILCGSFYSTPQNPIFRILQESFTYKGNSPTTLYNNDPIQVDYIFYTSDLCEPTITSYSLDNLLSSSEPSDHVPVQATFPIESRPPCPIAPSSSPALRLPPGLGLQSSKAPSHSPVEISNPLETEYYFGMSTDDIWKTVKEKLAPIASARSNIIFKNPYKSSSYASTLFAGFNIAFKDKLGLNQVDLYEKCSKEFENLLCHPYKLLKNTIEQMPYTPKKLLFLEVLKKTQEITGSF